MKIVQGLQQGSSDWLQFRATRFGSSEAAAMLGLSKHCTRSELLRIKHTGLDREFGDWFQRNVLDKGHAVEAATRPLIEAQLDDALYPVTVQGPGRLVGSCDGLTLDCALVWECKQWNEALAADVSEGRVPDTHMPQCQHLLLVTGAERLRFTVSDGTGERIVSTEVLPDAEWFQRLHNGWSRFEQDLAAYTPPAIPEPARAEPMDSLPAVAVRLDGALTVAGNLPIFAVALREFIAKMPTRPTTDNDFATVDAGCKALKRAEEALDAAEAGALASITDVEAMRRAVADCRKLARDTRLAAEKLVERRKVEIKEQAVAAARRALDDHIAALNAELAPMRLQPVLADFPGCIKGLRSFASMQDALDTTLAAGKIAADAQARLMRTNLAHFTKSAQGMEFLFADLGALVHKSHDDFEAVLAGRIRKQLDLVEAQEKKRQADEAQRIADAEKRAREQEAARIAEQQRQQAEAERQAAAALAAAAAPAPVVAPAQAPVFAAAQVVTPAQPVRAAAPVNEPATLNLSAINARFGGRIKLDTAGLALLGIEHSATDKSARLYRESDIGRICRALVVMCAEVQELQAA